MKESRRIVIVTLVALAAVWLLAPTPAVGQESALARTDTDDAARAELIAQRFEARARVLTVFDRKGSVVTTIGDRAIYLNPAFSPDRTRLAVAKVDLRNETWELWVLDLATGKETRIATSEKRSRVEYPTWSPDGSQVAYVASPGGHFGLYRKSSSGEGAEELLYQHPGGELYLTDWSLDGRYLSFSQTDLAGGGLYTLPLTGDGTRTPIEVLRSRSQVEGPSLSPDSRFLAYQSDESGRNEIYVRPFDPLATAGATPTAGPWQVSDEGGLERALWRSDGREMYYVAPNGGVMAVEVRTTPTFTFGKPRLLFRLSEAIPVSPILTSVSRDGERILIAVPHAPTLQQITMFDRQGTVLGLVGEPGRYRNPALSPDGQSVAVARIVPQTGSADIWTFDVASGAGTPVTSDTSPENAPVWSPDGTQVAYWSTRGDFTSIYHKASDGTGEEEHLYQYTPGAGLVLTDWSADGQFLTFHDGCSGVLHVVPLDGDRQARERNAIEWLRDEYSVAQARLSPDSSFIAYLSDEIEADTFEVYVRPFDGNPLEVGAGGTAVQVSTAGARGMIIWRQDGKELFYLTQDWEVMAVEVASTPAFRAGTPRRLFTLPGPVGGDPQQWKNVSRDGQHFVFALDVPASVSTR